MLTALVPLLYLGGFIASVKIFMSYYNRYRARSVVMEPWYPEQTKEKDAYQAIRLLPNVEKHHIMAGLMRRAKACVEQLSQVQATKPALTKLFQTQLVDGSLQTSLLITEALLIEEMGQVMQEAKLISPEWPRALLTTAVNMREFEKLEQIKKEMVEYRAKQTHTEKIWKSDMSVDDDEEDNDILILDNSDHLLD